MAWTKMWARDREVSGRRVVMGAGDDDGGDDADDGRGEEERTISGSAVRFACFFNIFRVASALAYWSYQKKRQVVSV